MSGEDTYCLEMLLCRNRSSLTDIPPPLPPRSILSTRRNAFDGDEFDVFSREVDARNVVFGKKEYVFPRGVLARSVERYLSIRC